VGDSSMRCMPQVSIGREASQIGGQPTRLSLDAYPASSTLAGSIREIPWIRTKESI
jgi:hypothetical protein